MRSRLLVSLLTLLLATPAAAMNHLVVLLDDCGFDGFSAFGVPDAPSTPTIDALSAEGVTFLNAWSNPLCGPTRASLLTGQLPRDHGFSWNMAPPVDPAGPSLPKAAAAAGLRTWHVGKWHLGDVETLPAELGFDASVGPEGNFEGHSYFGFVAYRDGEPETVTTYATTWQVDEAIAQVAAAGDDDWLGYLAFNAPHVPFHEPPCQLHSYGCDPLPNGFTRYRAAIEAVDTELARLLAAVPEDTMVYLACDNGTPKGVVSPDAPVRGGKGDPTEGGMRVPLIVAGPAVAETSEGAGTLAMAHLADLFATIGAIEGFAAPASSVDLTRYLVNPQATPKRQWMAAERFGDSSLIRVVKISGRWKLAWSDPLQPPAFYDLATDPMELSDLAPDGDTSALTPYQLATYETGLVLLVDTPGCADNIDNDLDGRTDLKDPQCTDLADDKERNSCGLGFEAGLALLLLMRRRRGRTARRPLAHR